LRRDAIPQFIEDGPFAITDYRPMGASDEEGLGAKHPAGMAEITPRQKARRVEILVRLED
jgi:hypothetical protein